MQMNRYRLESRLAEFAIEFDFRPDPVSTLIYRRIDVGLPRLRTRGTP